MKKIRTKGTYSRWRNGKQSLRSKTGRKEKGEETASVFVLKCVAKSLSLRLCLHVYVSYPGFLSGVCGSLAPISPPERSGTGRLAGWLAAQERKQFLSNSRWRTACAYTAETHTYRRAGVHACIPTHARNYVQRHSLLLRA